MERKELNVASVIQRDYKKELEARVGTKTLVNLDTGEGLGFKCKETGVILKDSMAYLDHINGKKQQKALGMSMRVERSTVDQVKNAFANAKRKKADASRTCEMYPASTTFMYTAPSSGLYVTEMRIILKYTCSTMTKIHLFSNFVGVKLVSPYALPIIKQFA